MHCNLSCNYHKLHINNKTNVGKSMLWWCTLPSPLVVHVLCKPITTREIRMMGRKDLFVSAGSHWTYLTAETLTLFFRVKTISHKMEAVHDFDYTTKKRRTICFKPMEKVNKKRGLLVEKLLQALSPLLNKSVIKYPIIPSKRQLPEQSFSWKWWDDHLR